MFSLLQLIRNYLVFVKVNTFLFGTWYQRSHITLFSLSSSCPNGLKSVFLLVTWSEADVWNWSVIDEQGHSPLLSVVDLSKANTLPQRDLFLYPSLSFYFSWSVRRCIDKREICCGIILAGVKNFSFSSSVSFDHGAQTCRDIQYIYGSAGVVRNLRTSEMW